MYLELRILLFSEKYIGPHHYNGAGASARTLYEYKNELTSLDILHNDVVSLDNRDSFWSSQYHVVKRKNMIINLVYLFFRAVNIIRKNNYSIVHVISGYWPSMVILLAAKLFRKRVVVKITSELSEAKRPSGVSIRIRTRQLLLRSADCVIAISSEIAIQLREISVSEGKILRLPNGVDTSRFFGQARRLDKAHPLRILFCGAVVPRKRLHLLLESLPFLLEKTDFHLTIAGPCLDVMYRTQCDSIVEKYALGKKITWLGFVDNVAPVFNKSDLLCLPSEKEGMANVVLEAMASGLPFVVTNTSGMNDLVAHGSGKLVGSKAIDISKGISDCITDYESMSQLGLKAVEMHYDSKVIHNRLISRFNEVLK